MGKANCRVQSPVTKFKSGGRGLGIIERPMTKFKSEGRGVSRDHRKMLYCHGGSVTSVTRKNLCNILKI